MAHTITIGGKETQIEWTQAVARRLSFRASKFGISIKPGDFLDPKRAASAYVESLWLLLPPDVVALYPTAEDLAAAIDHDTESKAIVSAVLQCLADMSPDAEKKSSSVSMPSQESS
jgi:hypothetical protein